MGIHVVLLNLQRKSPGKIPSFSALRCHRIRVPQQKGQMRMATLSVLKFNDPYGADRVLIALQGLQERQMITLEDDAVVSWPQGKRSQPPASYTARQEQVRAGVHSGASCSL